MKLSFLKCLHLHKLAHLDLELIVFTTRNNEISIQEKKTVNKRNSFKTAQHGQDYVGRFANKPEDLKHVQHSN